MSRSAIILKGCSAVGKGTRLSTLLEYLKIRYPHHSVFLNGFIGGQHIDKPFQVGVVFPTIKLFLLGKWVKSNKGSRLISWSSLDSYSKYQDTLFYDSYKFFDTYSIICEGYYSTRGNSILPSTIVPAGINNIRYFHYLYENIEELQERCLGRSGSRIKGSCYPDNKYYLKPENRDKEILKMRIEFSKFIEDGLIDSKSKMIYTFHSHKESPKVFCINTLNFLGLDCEIENFKLVYDKINTLRNVNNKEENYIKYEKYLGGDSSSVVMTEMYNEQGQLLKCNF